MVHGGGHHGGGGGGGSFSGAGGGVQHHGGRRNSSWTNTTPGNHIAVFNNNYYTSGWNSYQQSYIPQHQFGADNDECCELCWRRMCCILCCCAVPATFDTLRREQHPQKGCRWCQFLTVSIIFMCLCFLIFSFPGSDDWTLNAGETRPVVSASDLRTNHIAISTNIPESVSIYTFDGSCPPLTGPTIQISNTETIHLAQGDYQYDYFYLNAGSFLNVTLRQDYGASNLMVMRGLGTIQGGTNGESNDNGSFSSKALITRYAGAGQLAHVQYVAPKSDTYVVVYENASNSKGRSTVTYDVDLTTYDLHGITPVCDCESSIVCNFDLGGGRKCILVRAMSEVTVHISASRRLGSIVFYSIIPLSLLGCLFLRKRKEDDFENPPATAPAPHLEYVIAEPHVSSPATSAYPVATAIPESDVLVLQPSAPFHDKL
jgi:hypothetical protein